MKAEKETEIEKEKEKPLKTKENAKLKAKEKAKGPQPWRHKRRPNVDKSNVPFEFVHQNNTVPGIRQHQVDY